MYAESNSPQSRDSEYLLYVDRNFSGDATNASPQQVLRCANCDIEIRWPPTIVQGKAYCCTGCAAGGPCNCDYSQYSSVTISGVIHYTIEQGEHPNRANPE